MNAERLSQTLRLMMNTNAELQIPQHLQAVRDNLSNLTSSPNDSNYQTGVAQSLSRLISTMNRLREAITPSQMEFIKDIGGHRFFDPNMVSDIQSTINQNAMTPAVARDYVAQFVNERERYIATISSTHQGLEDLGIKGEHLQPGGAELAFLIPRDLFKNHLEELSEELHTLNLVIRQFSEVATGYPEPVEVHEISSSEPVFALGLSAATVVVIGKVVHWLLDTWKKVEEIKKLRQESKKVGFAEKELQDFFDDKITKTIEQEIEKRSKELTEKSALNSGRRNELENGINWAMHHIMGRIERGMVIEIRFLPPPEESSASVGMPDAEAKSQTYAELRTLSQQLQFHVAPGEPVLQLPPPEPPASQAKPDKQ